MAPTAAPSTLHDGLPPSLSLPLDASTSWLDAFAYVQWTLLLLAGLAAMFLLVHSVTFHRLKHRMADFILCIIGLSDLCFVVLEALRHHAGLTYASAYRDSDLDRMASPAALVAATLARFAFFMSLYWIASLSLLMHVGRVDALHVHRNFALSLVAASVYGTLLATLPALVTNAVAHALNAAAALVLQLAVLATILANLEVLRRTTRLNDNAHGRNVLRRLTGYVVCNALFSLPLALTQLCLRRYVAFGVVAESLTYLVPVTNAFLFGTSLACFCEAPTTSDSDIDNDVDGDAWRRDEKALSANANGHGNGHGSDSDACVGPLAEMVTTGPVMKIGEGSSAVVYRTQWLGITVAMKCIRLQGVTDDTQDLYLAHLSELQGTFFDEAALAAQLRHPNITLFIQLGTYKGSMCLVNEYCARGSLRDCLRANPLLEWATKVRLAFEAAKGLAFMHNRDPIYLHRDLKASNILVTEDWTAKIADFGISRIAPEFVLTTTRRRATLPVDDEADRETARHKTSFAGTWRWNAPEIMANPTACVFNRATDMYSFGVSMWELLTNGATPFGDVAFDHQVRALVAGGERPKIPPIYVSRAPPEFVDVLRACWDQEPMRRPTAQEVMLRLGSLSYTLANAPQEGRSRRATSTSRAVFSDNYYHAMDSARSCIIDL